MKIEDIAMLTSVKKISRERVLSLFEQLIKEANNLSSSENIYVKEDIDKIDDKLVRIYKIIKEED